MQGKEKKSRKQNVLTIQIERNDRFIGESKSTEREEKSKKKESHFNKVQLPIVYFQILEIYFKS